MPDQLHQFNINYVPLEDRILLRINTLQGDEYRIWLTRRYTGILLERLAAQMEKHGGAPALAAQPAGAAVYTVGPAGTHQTIQAAINEALVFVNIGIWYPYGIYQPYPPYPYHYHYRNAGAATSMGGGGMRHRLGHGLAMDIGGCR